MKALTLSLLTLAITGSSLRAQSYIGGGPNRPSLPPRYDEKTPPPLTLPEAYTVASARLGLLTNRFHCVSASYVEPSNTGFARWTFAYSNTNGQQIRVFVYFNKETNTDPPNLGTLDRVKTSAK